MTWLQRLPGYRRAAPGLEWTLWKRLPSILAWGTLLPALLGVVIGAIQPDASHAQGDRLLLIYRVVGVITLHWTLVLTLAIGCVVVIVMKGPAFVADPYPPTERDPDA
ncbi:MAG: hypothetical protein MUF30_09620 [Burkholderiales bacterium]|nr:hypothetical protein [Burkholderiales bacterium]